MGSLSLSEAALNRVAQVVLSDLRPLIYDLISVRVLFEEANTTVRNYVEKLRGQSVTENLLQSLVQVISGVLPELALLLSCHVVGMEVLDIRLKPEGLRDAGIKISPLFLSQIASLLPALTTLDLFVATVIDDFLKGLSESSAATSLTSLQLSRGFISDETASCWAAFSLLQNLNLSDNPLITRKTVGYIAQLPDLEVLKIGSNLVNCFETFLSCILAPDSCPNLTSLTIHSAPPSFQLDEVEEAQVKANVLILEEILQKRPNRNKLYYLDLPIPLYDHPDVLPRIHHLCPNLSTPMAQMWSQLLFSLPSDSLKQFVELHFQQDELSKADFEELIAALPSLQSLEISGRSFDPSIDLSIASHLTTLRIDFSGLPRAVRLPTQLRTLSFGLADARDSENAQDPLLRTILNLTSLRELTLGENDFDYSTESTLLSTLTNLRVFNIDDPSKRDHDLEIVYDAPNIRMMRISAPGPLTILPGKLPALVEFHGYWNGESDDTALFHLNPQRTPALRTLRVDFSNWDGDNDLPWRAYDRVVPLFANTLQDLRAVKVPPNFVSSLSKLMNLRRLDLQDAFVSAEDGAAILSALPLLSLLSCAHLNGHSDLMWLRHPRLSEFLYFGGENLTGEIRMSDEQLPGLVRFFLTSVPKAHVVVENMPSCLEIMLRTCEESSLRLVGLPKLLDLTIDSCRGATLDLDTIPRLRKLQISWCQLDTAHSSVNAPSLEEFSCHVYDNEDLVWFDSIGASLPEYRVHLERRNRPKSWDQFTVPTESARTR